MIFAMPDNVTQLKERIAQLEGQLLERESSLSLTSSLEGIKLMIVRWDREDKIRYANEPFCEYLGATKEDLTDHSIQILQSFFSSELTSRLNNLPSGPSIRFDYSDFERDKELDVSLKGNDDGYHDLILQDVSDQKKFQHYIRRYVPVSIKELSEDDLRTFRYPEKRIMSVSFSDLRQFTNMSEDMSPEGVRLIVNACFEEMIKAIVDNKATVDKIIGDEVMALYGAPVYNAQHALMAIKTACDQIYNLKALRKVFLKFNKSIPFCGIGINTGEMILGNIGSSFIQDYTVLGRNVNIASRLCDLAQADQILTTESTLTSVLENLPSDWEYCISENENNKSLEHGEPLPDHLKKRTIYIGPNTKTSTEKAYYIFRYVCTYHMKGLLAPTVIVSVEPGNVISRSEILEKINSNQQGEVVFGNYRLEEIIGTGGMGEVWKARDSLNNHIAIKLLKITQSHSSELMKRLKHEGDIMFQLRHPGICKVHNIGIHEDIPYIAMEIIDGVPLSHLLCFCEGDELNTNKDTMNIEKLHLLVENALLSHSHMPYPRTRRLSLINFFFLVGSLGESISIAHQRGIIHRDIKPSNIMIRKTGEPVLMDFGLSIEFNPSQSMNVRPIEGTLDYMAPEILCHQQAPSYHSDLYSFGALMYLLLTGHKHFTRSTNLIQYTQRLLNLTISPPSGMNNVISKELDAIVLKCLDPLPQNRYDNMDELLKELDSCRHNMFSRKKSKPKSGSLQSIKRWFK
jgi:serine/threonine protein kinase/class 3 adenylate cyclase